MSEKLLLTSTENYYQEAINMLDKKDSLGFMENIIYATIFSKDDEEFYAKVMFLKAKGLYLLREYDKALSAIEEALNYNTGDEKIRLLKYKGLIFYYRGYFKEAINIYESLLEQTKHFETLTSLYINLAAAYLAMYRTFEKENRFLEEAYRYLQATDQYFDLLQSNQRRKLICINYSEYYYLTGEHNKALEIQEQAIKYCQEKDLPEVYNNLAELCIIGDYLAKVKQYLRDAEIISASHRNYLEMAKCFYTTSKLELMDDEPLKALDSLYMALDFFVKAEALPFAFNCFLKILEVSKHFDTFCIQSLQKGIKGYFKDTPFYEKM